MFYSLIIEAHCTIALVKFGNLIPTMITKNELNIGIIARTSRQTIDYCQDYLTEEVLMWTN